MSFDAVGFFQRYGISYISEGHKHCRPGWLQVPCPFCSGNPGWHLGFNLEYGWWNCWRCGYKQTYPVVLTLLNGNLAEARSALVEFKGRPVARRKKDQRLNQILELPAGLQSLTSRAKKYLEQRQFNPDMLEAVWALQSTSNIGLLKHRIFIPIFFNNHMVSWQARDVTNLSGVKYLAQEEAKEIMTNKEVLYGLDQATNRCAVVVEGVADVWRLGPGAVATFGIKYTPAQVALLVENFEEIHFLYDPDPQAQVQADKLASDCSLFGAKCKLWFLDDCDPGDLSQADADELMREIGAGGY